MTRLPFNEFSNDLEYMESMDTAYHNTLKLEQESESFRLLRFKSRVEQSNAMKVDELTDLQKLQVEFHEQVKEWEQERVFNAIRDSFKGELYFDDAEDFIQTVKLKLKGK